MIFFLSICACLGVLLLIATPLLRYRPNRMPRDWSLLRRQIPTISQTSAPSYDPIGTSHSLIFLTQTFLPSYKRDFLADYYIQFIILNFCKLFNEVQSFMHQSIRYTRIEVNNIKLHKSGLFCTPILKFVSKLLGYIQCFCPLVVAQALPSGLINPI